MHHFSEEEIRTVVYDAIASTFRAPVDSVTAETTASDIDGWDSVSTSHLFFAIEDRLGRELPIGELLETANVGELVAALHRFMSEAGA